MSDDNITPTTAGAFFDLVVATQRGARWVPRVFDVTGDAVPVVRFLHVDEAGKPTGDHVHFRAGDEPIVVFNSAHYFPLAMLHSDRNWPASRKLRAAAWFGPAHKVFLAELHMVCPPPDASWYEAERQVEARLAKLLQGFEAQPH